MFALRLAWNLRLPILVRCEALLLQERIISASSHPFPLFLIGEHDYLGCATRVSSKKVGECVSFGGLGESRFIRDNDSTLGEKDEREISRWMETDYLALAETLVVHRELSVFPRTCFPLFLTRRATSATRFVSNRVNSRVSIGSKIRGSRENIAGYRADRSGHA